MHVDIHKRKHGEKLISLLCSFLEALPMMLHSQVKHFHSIHSILVWIIILMNIQPDSSLTFLLFTKLEELVQNFVLIILCLCYHRALSLSYLNKTCSVQCFTRECNIMGSASKKLHNKEISFSPCFLLWMSTCIFCFTSIRTCLNTAEM